MGYFPLLKQKFEIFQNMLKKEEKIQNLRASVNLKKTVFER